MLPQKSEERLQDQETSQLHSAVCHMYIAPVILNSLLQVHL
jgi:hypothetical protein